MNKKKINKEETIDIVSVFSLLYNKKDLIIKASFLIFFLSLLYSISLKNEYKSFTTFYPHYENVQNSNIQGLAGLAGINLNTQASVDIPHKLYPELIKSNRFKYDILKTNIEYNDSIYIYKDYLNSKKSSFNLKVLVTHPINLIKNIFISKNEKIIKSDINEFKFITEDDEKLFNILNQKIGININEQEGFIELYVIDNDPIVSAKVAKVANEILQKNIIEFKIKNTKDLYDFTESQLEIAKINLYKLQDSLANFKDNNISIKSDLFLNKLNRLETELNISKNIYNELALTKEKTAIDLRKSTPIFTIINEVYVPFLKDSPKRSIIVLTFTFIGILLICSWIIFKKPLEIFLREIIK